MGAEYYFNNMAQWMPGIFAVGLLIGIFILAWVVADDMDPDEPQPTIELRLAVRELFFNEDEPDEDQNIEQNDAEEK